MSQEKLQQLQMLEQNIQHIMHQKQNVQSTFIELESAIEELDTTSESYKIIGNVMVKVKPEDLKADLEEKKRVTELRVKTFEKQEEKLRSKVESLQKEVMESMEDGSGSSD